MGQQEVTQMSTLMDNDLLAKRHVNARAFPKMEDV